MSGAQHVVRIVGGGEISPAEQAAIVEAVTQVLESREASRTVRTSAWSTAGRLEGVGIATIRGRSWLPLA